MLKLSSHITIGQWSFDYVCNVKIDTSIETLTDTCTITIPRKLQWNGAAIAMGDSSLNGEPIIKRGDKVVVQCGYDGNMKTRFIGYIKNIKAGVPVTVECEDTMFLLKKGSITKSYPQRHSLKQLLTDIIPAGIEWFVPNDTQLEYCQAVNYTRVTPAKILEDLKEDSIYSYFRNITENGVTRSVLYSGLPYYTEFRNTANFQFGYNIIKDDLTYKRAEDISIKLVCISHFKDNKTIEKEFGDTDGEVRTFNFVDLNVNDLEIYGKRELDRIKHTGYFGNFTTFGVPELEKGDVSAVTGNQYHPDGSYLTKSVKIEFGMKGYRQIPVLDNIIS